MGEKLGKKKFLKNALGGFFLSRLYKTKLLKKTLFLKFPQKKNFWRPENSVSPALTLGPPFSRFALGPKKKPKTGNKKNAKENKKKLGKEWF